MAKARASPQTIPELLAQVSTWEPYIGPSGARLWKVPSSKGVGSYTVCDVSCSCPADQYARRGAVCKHRRMLAAYRDVGERYLSDMRTFRRLSGETQIRKVG